MSDSSDHENDFDDDYIGSDLNLTNILFGNINEHGDLIENDMFDNESKKQLSSLSKFGFGLKAIVKEMFKDVESETNNSINDHEKKFDIQQETNNDFNMVSDSHFVKLPNAVDYSDIRELAEDIYESEFNQTDYDAIEEKYQKKASALIKYEQKDSQKKLDTPLAAMLPSKYANVDVRELFPDFRPNQVLRFSRLFAPGKVGNLPQLWKNIRKKKKKKRDSSSEGNNGLKNDPENYNSRSSQHAPTPSTEDCHTDENILIIKDLKKELTKSIESAKPHDELGTKFSDWRFGPAQLWYDMLGVPENPEDFNYGFRLKEDNENLDDVANQESLIPDDAYLMVSQLHWEDNIVWDGDLIRNQVLSKLNSKTNAAGWVPSSANRTAQAFSQPGKIGVPIVTASNFKAASNISPAINTQNKSKTSILSSHKSSGSHHSQQQQQQQRTDCDDDTWYSIFPVENAELVYSDWEKEIIWDPENMSEIPKPKILTLDPNDENIVLGIPDDVDPTKQIASSTAPVKVKIPHPHVKKSKLLLGKAGVINLLQEDTPPPPPKSPNRDPFNISNDVYYMPRSELSVRLKVGGTNLIQHSTPVVELRPPFIPTHIGVIRLRIFHRTPIKRYSHGLLNLPGPHVAQPLLKHIKKKQQQREQERKASGGGDVFFMRTPEDLSGKDGDLILVEFSEEHPPLINQVGMCSKVKNYYKRILGKDTGPKQLRYGETAYVHTSPFLGILQPGQTFQAVENNMYRAPIYEHEIPPSDFLLIRTRQGYFIRECSALFLAGQQCPLYEVPGPNSKRANNFVRDFLQVFIYRLFWKSPDTPRRIRMDDIKKAFPSHSESSIRKRLKLCADFKRTGTDSNWWVIKPDFRLPSEEEIRAMVSPEQCCAYFSMIAAEQRLKDAGYGEKSLFATAEDDDEEMQLKMDDEVKVAPWNTTRAFIQAMKGKCLLQLTGPADPTGCGEGFSYVRVPNKPTQNKEEQESQPKRTVTGTDADLRRLSLNNAKALLKKFGVPDEEIKKLSRWEVIDVVRTLSTEKAKAGEEGMTKFSRGNRFSIAEHQERYKEECQRIFDLQNRVLCSSEVLSTDEGESTDDEDTSDIEEMGKNLENMLANKKTSTQLSLEREEQERQELRRMILEGSEERKNKEKKKDDEESQDPFTFSSQGRILKIHRTFKNPEGKEYTRVEIVRKPAVIDVYVRIRTTRDENFIRNFISLDEQQKEEMKREKRRIQEQLRRIKRNQEKERQANNLTNFAMKYNDDDYVPPPNLVKKVRKSAKADTKVRCSACGGLGHMRKTCKFIKNGSGFNEPSTSGLLEVEKREKLDEEELEKEPPIEDEDEELVNVDGTKVKLSSKLLKHAEEYKKQLIKNAAANRKRKRLAAESCDYLKKHLRPANRRRTDPVVVLSTIFENILNEIRDLPGSQPFCFPVNGKVVIDYYKIVQRPMDLQTIRENLRQKKYQSREEFIADINQIFENSTLYNGPNHTLTASAKQMLEKTIEKIREKEEISMKLEKAINPLLDDNDQVALSFIFENIVNTKLKVMSESWPFLKPVNKKVVKDYYNLIKRPMDLETVSSKITAHKYHNRAEFLQDIELIFINCELYNGKESTFTQKAASLLENCKTALQEFDEHLTQLEQKICITQEKAMEDAENDNSWLNDDDLNIGSSDSDGPDRKRNRGRPKKKNQVRLEDDLQFSSDDDDDDFDDVPSEGEESNLTQVENKT